MRWSAVSIVAAVVAALCFPPIATAADLVKQFESEHAAAWKKLEDVYSKIALTEEYQMAGRDRQGKKPIAVRHKGDGECWRSEIEYPEFGLIVTVAAPFASFTLEKPLGQSEFVVKDINRHGFAEFRNTIRYRGYLPSVAFSIIDARLIDFFATPKFEVVAYEVVMAEGAERLKVTWRSPITVEGVTGTRVGWFLFIPGSWALSEFEFRYGAEKFGAIRGRVEYDGFHEGSPLVKSMVR